LFAVEIWIDLTVKQQEFRFLNGKRNFTGMPFFGETAATGIIVDMRTATVSFEVVFHVS